MHKSLALAQISLVLLVLSITLALQVWVGGVSVYAPELSERRQTLHEAIFNNRLPEEASSWTMLGANDVNVRVGTVYFAEYAHRVSGVKVLTIYKLMDTAALFAGLLLVFVYLRENHDPVYALLGMLYVAAILPLTYFLGYFHPWDRVSMACWVGLLILLRRDQMLAFLGLFVVSIVIKYDTIFLPVLYFLANATRQNWKQVAIRTALLLVLSFGLWIGLRALLPGGFEERDVIAQFYRNLGDFKSTWYAYPPFLGMGLSIVLALAGLRWSDKFARASVVFGLFLLIPFFTRSNFIEMRAEMPVLLLMLPSAVACVRALCEGEMRQAHSEPVAAASLASAPVEQ
jgi:hypothetical protein